MSMFKRWQRWRCWSWVFHSHCVLRLTTSNVTFYRNKYPCSNTGKDNDAGAGFYGRIPFLKPKNLNYLARWLGINDDCVSNSLVQGLVQSRLSLQRQKSKPCHRNLQSTPKLQDHVTKIIFLSRSAAAHLWKQHSTKTNPKKRKTKPKHKKFPLHQINT